MLSPLVQLIAVAVFFLSLFFVVSPAIWSSRSWRTMVELAPVLHLLRHVRWPSTWKKKETSFTRALADVIHRELGVPPENESVVASRTQVDVHFRYEGREWFVTVKNGLDNQKRLTLQGELEDIFRDCSERRVQKMALVILIGVEDAKRREIDVQIEALERCLSEWVRRRSADYQIIRVPILPVREDELLEPDDDQAIEGHDRPPTFIEKLHLPIRWALFWQHVSALFAAFQQQARGSIVAFLAVISVLGVSLALSVWIGEPPAPAATDQSVDCVVVPEAYPLHGQKVRCPPARAPTGHAVDAGAQ